MAPKDGTKKEKAKAAPKKGDGKGDGKGGKAGKTGKKGKVALETGVETDSSDDPDKKERNALFDSLLPPPPPDSDEEEEGPPKACAKLFMLPRDAKRIMEIEVEEGKDGETRVRPIGTDLGDKVNGKYIAAAKSRTIPGLFAMPYGMKKVLHIDPITSRVKEIGKFVASFGDDKMSEHKYTAAVTCSNWHGRMFAAPNRATRVLEIDPVKGLVNEVGPKIGPNDVSKYYAIACQPLGLGTGKIYAIPYDARRVLEIPPNYPHKAKEIGPDLGAMKAKYKSCTLGPLGDIYCAPFNAPRVLHISIEGEVTIIGPDFGKKERKFACIVTAPNKLMYAPPLYADKVIEINPNKGFTREIGPVLGCGEAKYACAAVASNGNVYCAPLEARFCLEIKCLDHEVTEMGMDLGEGAEKYSGIAAAPLGGKLYAAPREARKILELDPGLDIVREIGMDLGSVYRKYTCIVPGLNHKEILEAGRNAVYDATKALDRATRWKTFAQMDLDKAKAEMNACVDKLERAKSSIGPAEEDLEAAIEEEAEREKVRTKGSAEAAAWVRARDETRMLSDRVKSYKERQKRYQVEHDQQVDTLERAQTKFNEKNEACEKAQKELDQRIEEAEAASLKEAEARRQADETEAERKENERKFA